MGCVTGRSHLGTTVAICLRNQTDQFKEVESKITAIWTSYTSADGTKKAYCSFQAVLSISVIKTTSSTFKYLDHCYECINIAINTGTKFVFFYLLLRWLSFLIRFNVVVFKTCYHNNITYLNISEHLAQD